MGRTQTPGPFKESGKVGIWGADGLRSDRVQHLAWIGGGGAALELEKERESAWECEGCGGPTATPKIPPVKDVF